MKNSKVKKDNTAKVEISNDLRTLMDTIKFIPEPTYIHEVGEEVSIGSLRGVTIEEIIENGKIYKIDYTSYNNKCGKIIVTPNNKRYVMWTDVRKKVTNNDSFIENKDINLRFMQDSIRGLLGKVYEFGVNFEPDYQREYVWDMEDKVKLIDSIFKNVEIGKFVFIFKGYENGTLYEILDGKQRFRAILDFYEDRFSYKGKFFSDLSELDKKHIINYSISTCEVEELTEEQILRYFLYLNRFGKAMSEEHLQKIENRLAKFTISLKGKNI